MPSSIFDGYLQQLPPDLQAQIKAIGMGTVDVNGFSYGQVGVQTADSGFTPSGYQGWRTGQSSAGDMSAVYGADGGFSNTWKLGSEPYFNAQDLTGMASIALMALGGGAAAGAFGEAGAAGAAGGAVGETAGDVAAGLTGGAGAGAGGTTAGEVLTKAALDGTTDVAGAGSSAYNIATGATASDIATGAADSTITGLASSDTAFAQALADSGMSPSAFSQLVSSLGLDPSSLSSIAKSLGGWGNLIGGIASIYAGNQGTKTANNILQQGNPFGQFRQYFGDQLMALEKDPSSITKSPGYASGEQAVQRSMMSQGYGGSGNMATALMDYGNNFFTGRENQLATLAGAGINPNAALQTAANVQGGSIATEANGLNMLFKYFAGLGAGNNTQSVTGGAAS